MPNPYTNENPTISDFLGMEGFSGGAPDLGLQGMTLAEGYLATGTKLTVGGSLYLTPLRMAGAGPLSGFYTDVTTINGTPTANQSLMGLYSLNSTTGVLTLVAQSVDMGTVWGSTGKQVGAFASGVGSVSTVGGTVQLSVTEGIKYYVAVMNVATTPVTLAATPASTTAAVTGLSGVITSSVAVSPHQAGTFIAGTSLTALPTTVNLGTATITVQTQVLLLGIY